MSNETPAVSASLWRTVHRLEGGAAWPPCEPVDVARFVAAVRRHRLLPLAAAAGFAEPAAAAVHAAQRADAARVAAIVDRQRATLARLLDVLPASEWIALKGIDYGRRLYGDPCLREMDDIDLLVRPERFRAAGGTLIAAGFVERVAAGPLERSFRDPAHDVVLDVYRGLIQTARVAIDYDALWSASIVGDDGVRRPAPAHALVAHALVMANLQYATHLRKYVDLWLMCRDADVVRQAIDTAARWRMRRAFYASLRLLADAIPEVDDAPWRPALDALLGASERRALQRWVLPRAPVVPLPARPLALWRKFGLIDGHDQRMRFAFRHVLPLPARWRRGDQNV